MSVKRRFKAAPPVAHPAAAYAREGETVLIEINLRQIGQLYNSFDPSPFHEKELDNEADRYIFSAAREIGADKPMKLVIYLPSEASASAEAKSVEQSIRGHFVYRLQTARRDLRHELQRGRISLAIGLAFLAVCVAAREFALGVFPEAVRRIFGEGLLIIGWVAMWGPLEVFLYGWWPISSNCRILERLANLDVEVRSLGAGRSAPGLGRPTASG